MSAKRMRTCDQCGEKYLPLGATSQPALYCQTCDPYGIKSRREYARRHTRDYWTNLEVEASRRRARAAKECP